jgi:hypothetical protein
MLCRTRDRRQALQSGYNEVIRGRNIELNISIEGRELVVPCAARTGFHEMTAESICGEDLNLVLPKS